MAMAMAAAEALEQELSCPICLERYREPVSLDCGHSFCTLCIQGALQSQQSQRRSYSCPLCQTPYAHIPQLHRNFPLASIVQSVPGLQPPPGAIPCDYCLEPSSAAVKTCLSCEVALCQQHLDKHNKKLGEKGHTLLEPGSSLQDRTCPLHSKLLECYCRQDRACVCMVCSVIGPHKGHDLSTLREEQLSLEVSLSKMENELVKTEKALMKGFEELARSKEKLQSNANCLMQQVQDLFKDILSQINRKQEEVLEAIRSKEASELARLDEVARKMKENQDTASQRLQMLRSIKAKTDPLLFIKAYLSSQERFKNQDFSTENMKVQEMQAEEPLCQHIRNQTANYITTIDPLLQSVNQSLSLKTWWFRAVPKDEELVPENAAEFGFPFVRPIQTSPFSFQQCPQERVISLDGLKLKKKKQGSPKAFGGFYR